MPKTTQKAMEDLTRMLIDSGRVVESGWVGYRHACVPKAASQTQYNETKMAFFAGARHLLSSIYRMLDDNAECVDVERLKKMEAELDAFLVNSVSRTSGHARSTPS